MLAIILVRDWDDKEESIAQLSIIFLFKCLKNCVEIDRLSIAQLINSIAEGSLQFKHFINLDAIVKCRWEKRNKIPLPT